MIEAEDRPSLDRFNADLLGGRYGHVMMLIDGNDTRGIDVGIMTSPHVEIDSMRSHVDVPDPGAAGEHLFSRDCATYLCRAPSGAKVWVLLNHFKSQSGGGGAERSRQAQGVRDIVDRLNAAGERNIVVMGDLNEGPTAAGQAAANLGALHGANGPLVEAYAAPAFNSGPRPGTFQRCALRERLDYIFVSTDLVPRILGGGLERRGLWGGPTNVNRRPTGPSTRRSPPPAMPRRITLRSSWTSTSSRLSLTSIREPVRALPETVSGNRRLGKEVNGRRVAEAIRDGH